MRLACRFRQLHLGNPGLNFRFFIKRSDHPLARIIRRFYRGLRTFTLPAPKVVVLPMLWAYLTFRTVYYYTARIFFCEPLFKAYCTRYGRGVKTGVYVHWIYGHGTIILGNNVTVDGKSNFIFTNIYCKEPTIEIGDNTYISHNCFFSVGRHISIGRHCLVASGTKMFEFSGHPTDPSARLASLPTPAENVKPITVEDNVWIGTDCLIMPGVTIGEGSVVSAGSLVRGDVPRYTIVAGNPARPVAALRIPGANPFPGTGVGDLGEDCSES